MNNLVEFTRIKDWWYLEGIFLLGLIFSGIYHSLQTNDLLICFLIPSLYLLHGYSINEYYDNQILYFHKNNNNKAFFLSIPLAALIINLYLSLTVSKLLFVVIFLGATLSWIYSAPPLFLKKSAYGRLLLNGLGFSLLFLAGATFRSDLTLHKIFFFVYVFLLFIPIEAIHDLDDMISDREDDIITVPLKYGVDFNIDLIIRCLAVLFMYSVILYFIGHSSFYICAATLIMSLCISVILKKSKKRTKTDTRLFKGIKGKSKIIFAIYGICLLIIFIKHL